MYPGLLLSYPQCRGSRHAADPRNLGSCRLAGFAYGFGSACIYRFMAISFIRCEARIASSVSVYPGAT
jgi:hypothetical protein